MECATATQQVVEVLLVTHRHPNGTTPQNHVMYILLQYTLTECNVYIVGPFVPRHTSINTLESHAYIHS